MVASKNIQKNDIEALLEQVYDPEIPVLSVMDMGIVRKVAFENGRWEIHITPTYSGCPAIDAIQSSIESVMEAHRIPHHIEITLSDTWTTDWMTPQAHQRLKEYGIAPPVGKAPGCGIRLFDAAPEVPCPQCESRHTHMIAEFSSTACKAMYQCDDCKETFDYFKCH